ncbi:MAG: PBSX family phage terminase large subunit [Oscillospiraceae bacterium]|nr:PBSX family phage terminase large subunit [Oscillospiraceae bacterium]
MVKLAEVVGGGYEAFWKFKGRYRVVKGGRASKKSKTAALNFIVRLMQHPDANLLVVRKTYRTLKDSCYAELNWAIRRLGVDMLWVCRESPLEMIYRPTGQKILFRGLDDAMKVTSIAVNRGVLCWLWIEEAFEIGDEKDFQMLDESIRGQVSAPLFKQITLTFNPWRRGHWLKKRFFDREQGTDVLAMTVTYACNEFIDEGDRRLFETLETRDPQRYGVVGLGEWGESQSLVFGNVKLQPIDKEDIEALDRPLYGLDWGYYPDPTAFIACAMRGNQLLIYDEWVAWRASSFDVYDALCGRGVSGEDMIICDNSDKRSIADLRGYGLRRAMAASKGPGSLRYSMKWLQSLDAIVIDAARCPKAAEEFVAYEYGRHVDGALIEAFADARNHCIDAVRYACNEVWKLGISSL